MSKELIEEYKALRRAKNIVSNEVLRLYKKEKKGNLSNFEKILLSAKEDLHSDLNTEENKINEKLREMGIDTYELLFDKEKMTKIEKYEECLILASELLKLYAENDLRIELNGEKDDRLDLFDELLKITNKIRELSDYNIGMSDSFEDIKTNIRKKLKISQFELKAYKKNK